MRYYVLTDDGHKYGPADVQTLNQWIAENRLVPLQMLEEEGTGARYAAQVIPGLNFPAPVNYAQGPGTPPPPGPAYTGYYRPPGGHSGDDGSRDITPAWVLFGVGVLSCCLSPFLAIALGGVGVYYANQGRQKGHPQGGTVFSLNVALLTLAIVYAIASIAIGATSISNMSFG